MIHTTTDGNPTTTPTVNVYGTDAATLLHSYDLAVDALSTALHVMDATRPMERDYYMQSDSAYRSAEREHVARLEAVIAVRDELARIRDRIHGQMPYSENEISR